MGQGCVVITMVGGGASVGNVGGNGDGSGVCGHYGIAGSIGGEM